MEAFQENPAYLTRQLITYIGNKRSLLGFIGTALDRVKKRLGREKLRLFDVFSGSGVVARFFKQHSQLLVANDIEMYAETINRCYLANKTEINIPELKALYDELAIKLNQDTLHGGFISELYAPGDDSRIEAHERVFYTPRNARYLDTARQYIEHIDEKLRPFFIAPLLSEASIHANTAGIFKGFYKDRKTGKGSYGGTGGDALTRITGDIVLPFPEWSNFDCEVKIFKEDANSLAAGAAGNAGKLELDAAYLDPPYNQHPYGSNYFMLNLITSYRRPVDPSPVSGIPADWIRSAYNKRESALRSFTDLVEKLTAKFLIVSFNSEGFISKEEMQIILEKVGKLEIFEIPYNTFRGSRNLRNRDLHVKEYLYLVEKKG